MDTDNLDNNSKGEKITVPIADQLVIPNFNFTTEKYDETEADLNVRSIYFSDEIDLSDQFNMVLGGRFDDFDLSVVDVYGNSGGNASKVDESSRLALVLYLNPRKFVSVR